MRAKSTEKANLAQQNFLNDSFREVYAPMGAQVSVDSFTCFNVDAEAELARIANSKSECPQRESPPKIGGGQNVGSGGEVKAANDLNSFFN